MVDRLRAWLRGAGGRAGGYARRWWKRNVIDDAAPFTDDEAERWKHRG